jgi:prepilin-type N-terminal cleavage/methylation domain-containing protein/prepilin-type processing-associated H-X9-DG protein
MATQQTSSQSSGFNLLELLVVVGMISVLMTILLPVLSRAKSAARMIGCMNNERQLAATWYLYSSDNCEKLVANGIPIRVPTDNIKWVQGEFLFLEDRTNTDLLLNPCQALYARYIPTARTYICPSAPPVATYQEISGPRCRSYAMNNFLGLTWPADPTLEYDFWKIYHKTGDLDRPAELFLVQDVNLSSVCWPYFGVHMGRDSFFNFPSSDHAGGGVISYCDGHVGLHKWQDQRTIQAQSQDYHVHDDPSPGNPDIRWLQTHATSAR